MKKITKKIVLLLIALMIISTIAGCADNKGTDAPNVEQPGKPDDSNEPAGEEKPADDAPKYGGTLYYIGMGDAANFNPHINFGGPSYQILGNIYECLVEFDSNGTIQPALAESWEQPDARTFIFHLRKGVKFHDGTDFNADDVIASIERISNPDTTATLGNLYSAFASVEKIDEYTVKIVNNQDDVFFIGNFALNCAYMVSKEDIDSGFDFNTSCNGTGPFSIGQWEGGRQYELVKNQNYWKEGLPYVDKIIMMPVPDTNTRVNMLLAGESHFSESIPFADFERVEQAGHSLGKNYATSLLRVNTNKAPFDNVKMRQALAYILDREAIAMLTWGKEGIALHDGFALDKNSEFYYPEIADMYTVNHEKALEFLKEAGYNSPADVPAFLVTSTQTPNNKDIAMVVVQQLKDFGLNVELDPIDAPTLKLLRASGDYQLLQEGMMYNMPNEVLNYFHSKQGSYHAVGSKYKNEELDKLLEEGITIMDEKKSYEHYKRVFEILSEDLPFVFEIQRPSAVGLSSVLRGYEVFADPISGYAQSQFENLWLDE